MNYTVIKDYERGTCIVETACSISYHDFMRVRNGKGEIVGTLDADTFSEATQKAKELYNA